LFSAAETIVLFFYTCSVQIPELQRMQRDTKVLIGILLSSLEKTKKKDQKRAFCTPVGSKRITMGSRVKLETYTLNRERKVMIPSVSHTAN